MFAEIIIQTNQFVCASDKFIYDDANVYGINTRFSKVRIFQFKKI